MQLNAEATFSAVTVGEKLGKPLAAELCTDSVLLL